MNDKTFEAILYNLRKTNASGYPVLYPPMPVWRRLQDGGRLLRAWRASPASEPLDLHARIPFCRTICSFCFLPVRGFPRNSADSYLDALEKEARSYSKVVSHRRCRSFYLAGGTPNALPLKALERIFGIVRREFRFKGSAQWSMDANPEFLTREQTAALKSWGVNWLTIGVQSLDDAVIGRTARTQTNAKVLEAYENARRAGVAGVNIDLMCGLPGQAPESFLRDAETVASWRPDQIHLYLFKPLSITPFARSGGAMADAEVRRWKELQRRALDLVLQTGYLRIDEESAALGRRRVNSQTQRLFAEPFSMLGLGMGAVSLIYSAARYVNTMDQASYEARLAEGKIPVEKGAPLSPRHEMINYLLLQFAEAQRVSDRRFERIFSERLDRRFGPALSALVGRGVLRRRPAGYEATTDRAFFEVPKALYEPKVLGALARHYRLEAG